MTTKRHSPINKAGPKTWSHYLPVLSWATDYRPEYWVGDLLAGLIVGIMLVPQSMAYAMLAGLPPQIGLYASIAPLIVYGLLGSSRFLAVGPVAIVSILVATGISPLAEPGSAAYVQLAITLAFLVAIIQLGLGLVRLGFLVNFLSHPVLVGFTSAAAIVIGLSQIKHLLGLSIPRATHVHETLGLILSQIGQTNLATLVLGVSSISLLLYFKWSLARHLEMLGLGQRLIVSLTKTGPLVIVLLSILIVWGFDLNRQCAVEIVGQVPAGLPPLTWPDFDLAQWELLLPTALTISFVGYLESISVAKSLASKRRQKVAANQELIALGLANISVTLTGGYPVTGGLSRSVVNFAAGANTGLASIITALLIAVTVMFFTPLFYFLPNAVLAAIILVAVMGLVDTKVMLHIWQYDKGDGLALLITFLAVLMVSIEMGILIGVGATILIFVWRTSRPHAAIVGRLGESEAYRNVLRHDVTTYPNVIAIRVDESLYFANTKYLEELVLRFIVDRPEVDHIVLIGLAINFIDASALETLENLQYELASSHVTLHLADMKGPVMDRLSDIGFVEIIGPEHIHVTTHQALQTLGRP